MWFANSFCLQHWKVREESRIESKERTGVIYRAQNFYAQASYLMFSQIVDL